MSVFDNLPDPFDYQTYIALVMRWVDAKNVDVQCSVCGESKWLVLPLAELPLRSTELGGLFVGKAVPVVPLACDVCGNLILFNASRIPEIRDAIDKAEGS